MICWGVLTNFTSILFKEWSLVDKVGKNTYFEYIVYSHIISDSDQTCILVLLKHEYDGGLLNRFEHLVQLF